MSSAVSNDRRSRVSRGGNPNAVKNSTPTPDDETEVCLICANKIQYASILPCNHTVCHMCSFRQRALYDRKACLVCRTENDRLVYSEDIDKQYLDFSRKDYVRSSEKYQIDFTADYVFSDTLALLENTCSVCSNTFPSFNALVNHTNEEHNKHYCLICLKNKKAFVSEFTTYTQKQLQRHQSEGDGIGFKGHPECKHCRGKRFYLDDELNVHIRDKHERCHICDRDFPKTADYYRNYDALYVHFRHDHYVCLVPECVEKRFVVFKEDLDLTAHMLKDHGGLTGSTGKVVLGATGRQFQLQLLTFLAGSSRNKARDPAPDTDSYDTKKMRMEERAKHYLNYNTSKISAFQQLNASYRSKKIEASALLSAYKDLFSSNTDEEISILLGEFTELFSLASEQYKALSTVSDDFRASVDKKVLFPALGRGTSKPINVHSWGGALSRSPLENFPALAKPTKKAPVAPTQPAIRYTTIIKKQPKPQTSMQQASLDYRPNYLNKTSSASSLPALGLATYANGSSSNSRLNSPCSLSVNLLRFPALEKKPAKKVFPRVNPIPSGPGQWGAARNDSSSNEGQSENEPMLVIKKKGKKKQILFSNDI